MSEPPSYAGFMFCHVWHVCGRYAYSDISSRVISGVVNYELESKAGAGVELGASSTLSLQCGRLHRRVEVR